MFQVRSIYTFSSLLTYVLLTVYTRTSPTIDAGTNLQNGEIYYLLYMGPIIYSYPQALRTQPGCVKEHSGDDSQVWPVYGQWLGSLLERECIARLGIWVCQTSADLHNYSGSHGRSAVRTSPGGNLQLSTSTASDSSIHLFIPLDSESWILNLRLRGPPAKSFWPRFQS